MPRLNPAEKAAARRRLARKLGVSQSAISDTELEKAIAGGTIDPSSRSSSDSDGSGGDCG